MAFMDRNNFSFIPKELWRHVEPLLRAEGDSSALGRPRIPDKRVFAGIVFRLRTGCQWKAIPRQFGSGSTCHRRFQQWVEDGVCKKIFVEMLRFYHELRGAELAWTSLDTAMVKAPKGGT